MSPFELMPSKMLLIASASTTCAYVFGEAPFFAVTNAAATCQLVWPARLPNRLGKFDASQLPRAVEVAPPFSQVITPWPFLFAQKPIVAVSPLPRPVEG